MAYKCFLRFTKTYNGLQRFQMLTKVTKAFKGYKCLQRIQRLTKFTKAYKGYSIDPTSSEIES